MRNGKKPGPALRVGTYVYTSAGEVGKVEGTTRANAPGEATMVRVVSNDGSAHYQFPLALVGPIQRVNRRNIVYLQLSPEELPRFRVSGRGAELRTEDSFRIPLAVEELTVEKHPVRRGTVHLHKWVEEQQQTLTIPLTTESAIIERIPADQFDPNHPYDPDDIIIPITEERLVVQKEVVVTEYIRVRKQRMSKRQVASATVRRERLDVVSEPAPDQANEQPLVQLDTAAQRENNTEAQA